MFRTISDYLAGFAVGSTISAGDYGYNPQQGQKVGATIWSTGSVDQEGITMHELLAKSLTEIKEHANFLIRSEDLFEEDSIRITLFRLNKMFETISEALPGPAIEVFLSSPGSTLTELERNQLNLKQVRYALEAQRAILRLAAEENQDPSIQLMNQEEIKEVDNLLECLEMKFENSNIKCRSVFRGWLHELKIGKKA